MSSTIPSATKSAAVLRPITVSSAVMEVVPSALTARRESMDGAVVSLSSAFCGWASCAVPGREGEGEDVGAGPAANSENDEASDLGEEERADEDALFGRFDFGGGSRGVEEAHERVDKWYRQGSRFGLVEHNGKEGRKNDGCDMRKAMGQTINDRPRRM